MATPKKKHLIELMIEAGVKWPEGAEYAAQDKTTNDLCFYRSKPVHRARFKDEWRPSGFDIPDGLVGRRINLPSLCRNWHQTIVTREQYAEAVAAIPMTPAVQQEAKPGDEWEPVKWGDWDVGDMVRFNGFTNELHNHWSFKVGNEYAIGCQMAPISARGEQPGSNYGFSFSRRKEPAAQLYSGVAGVMPSESIEQLAADYHAKAAEAERLQSVADEAIKAADDALLALEKAGELLGLVISIDTKPVQV